MPGTNFPSIRVVPWDKETPVPTEQEAEARLHQEGYNVFRWHDVAGVNYPRHRHSHDECLWILKGELDINRGGGALVIIDLRLSQGRAA